MSLKLCRVGTFHEGHHLCIILVVNQLCVQLLLPGLPVSSTVMIGRGPAEVALRGEDRASHLGHGRIVLRHRHVLLLLLEHALLPELLLFLPSGQLLLHLARQQRDLLHESLQLLLCLTMHLRDLLFKLFHLGALLLVDALQLDDLLDLLMVDLDYVAVALLFLELCLPQSSRFDLSLVDWARLSASRTTGPSFGLGRVEQVEPVKKLGVFPQGAPVLIVADRLIVIIVDLLKDLINLVAIDANILVHQAAPMRNHLGEVVMELRESDVSVCKSVHQGETECVLFVLLAIAQDVHNRGELLEIQIAEPFDVEDFEHAVG